MFGYLDEAWRGEIGDEIRLEADVGRGHTIGHQSFVEEPPRFVRPQRAIPCHRRNQKHP